MRRLERSGKKAILTKLPSVRGKLRFRRFLRAQEISRARAVDRRVSFFLHFFFKKKSLAETAIHQRRGVGVETQESDRLYRRCHCPLHAKLSGRNYTRSDDATYPLSCKHAWQWQHLSGEIRAV